MTLYSLDSDGGSRHGEILSHIQFRKLFEIRPALIGMISVFPSQKKSAPDIPWSPPSPGGLKWNVDASFNPRLNRAAIGGVLRNHRGEFICMFSTPIPSMEINDAEVNAIFRAVQISLLNDSRIHLDDMVIESDSLNAVRWCHSSDDGPWNLNFHLNLIRNTLNQNQSILLIHHPRSSNHVADALAKQGLHISSEFIAWI